MTKLVLITVFLAAFSSVLAQTDLGVETVTDEFTGAVTCRQIVLHSATDFTGLHLVNEEGELAVFIVRAVEDDLAFNRFGARDGAQVYIRWPNDEVEPFTPLATLYQSSNNYEVAILDGHQSELLNRMLDSPDDLRVRFEGSNGRRDFTLQHALFQMLADGFGQECLD